MYFPGTLKKKNTKKMVVNVQPLKIFKNYFQEPDKAIYNSKRYFAPFQQHFNTYLCIKVQCGNAARQFSLIANMRNRYKMHYTYFTYRCCWCTFTYKFNLLCIFAAWVCYCLIATHKIAITSCDTQHYMLLQVSVNSLCSHITLKWNTLWTNSIIEGNIFIINSTSSIRVSWGDVTF